MSSPSILLLSKTSDVCRAAQRFVRAHAPGSVIVEGARTDRMPDIVTSWSGDYLISFLGPWIVPRRALDNAGQGRLNFHPGPPEYPGIGCYNFALYDEVDEYGVTCHEMEPRVDTGRILKVVRFPVFAGDTVELLKERSVAHLLVLFYEVIGRLLRGEALTPSTEQWTRRPYTRRELDALCVLRHDMDAAEVARRVRATTFPGAPGPYYADGQDSGSPDSHHA